MGIFNLIITVIVCAVLLVGGGMTYHYRMMERHAEMEANPYGAIVNPPVKGSGLAALPKWDDKNWKGVTHHPAGTFKSASAKSGSTPSKQTPPR